MVQEMVIPSFWEIYFPLEYTLCYTGHNVNSQMDGNVDLSRVLPPTYPLGTTIRTSLNASKLASIE